MLRLISVSIAALLSGFRSRRELILENLALRQQLATLVQKRRPLIMPAERAFWVVLRRLWSRWAAAIVIVKPETVIGWHRAGFALHWRRLSGPARGGGRPGVGREVRDLIRRMASENGWGAPRIHGELTKLGFTISERSVSRYLRALCPRPERRQGWLTFLRNHREVIVAMDFFTVPTATFRLLYVWFAIRHGPALAGCTTGTRGAPLRRSPRAADPRLPYPHRLEALSPFVMPLRARLDPDASSRHLPVPTTSDRDLANDTHGGHRLLPPGLRHTAPPRE